MGEGAPGAMCAKRVISSLDNGGREGYEGRRQGRKGVLDQHFINAAHGTGRAGQNQTHAISQDRG